MLAAPGPSHLPSMSDSLSQYTLEELERLLAEINHTIEQREHAAAVQNPASAPAATPADAAERGAVAAVAGAAIPAADAAEEAAADAAEEEVEPPVRYVHPASRNLSWTGIGDVPDWVTAYLAYGGSWSAMENAAEQYLDGIAKRKALNWPPARDRR